MSVRVLVAGRVGAFIHIGSGSTLVLHEELGLDHKCRRAAVASWKGLVQVRWAKERAGFVENDVLATDCHHEDFGQSALRLLDSCLDWSTDD